MEEEEKKESENEAHHNKRNLTEKIRENPWILSTLVCGALVIILLIATFSDGLTGNVTKEKAADNLMNYLNTVVTDSPITLVSVENSDGLYLATISYQEQEIPVYITKDGKYYAPNLVPITASVSSNTNTRTTEVPKTNKPSVELYVFTYCPYGLQMEKAMIPVAKLLGNNIDFKIRQIGAMHGDFEKVEAERQLCIEKNYPEKFLDYVLAFAEDTSCTNGANSCVTTKVNALYSKLGIDGSKINACMASEGTALYNAEVSNADSKGVSGSPTVLVNGVGASLSRSQEAVKGAICEAFNTVPSSCTQTLSTSQASPGFGAGASSSSAAGTQCATA